MEHRRPGIWSASVHHRWVHALDLWCRIECERHTSSRLPGSLFQFPIRHVHTTELHTLGELAMLTMQRCHVPFRKNDHHSPSNDMRNHLWLCSILLLHFWPILKLSHNLLVYKTSQALRLRLRLRHSFRILSCLYFFTPYLVLKNRGHKPALQSQMADVRWHVLKFSFFWVQSTMTRCFMELNSFTGLES